LVYLTVDALGSLLALFVTLASVVERKEVAEHVPGLSERVDPRCVTPL